MASGLPPGQFPRTPSLDRLLTRSDLRSTPGRDPLKTLVASFGVHPATRPDQDSPPTRTRHSARTPESNVRDGKVPADMGHEDAGLRAAGADHDLPTAPLCLLAEAPELAAQGCWFHADPVHLRPDRDRLLLFGGPSLGVTADESAALVAAFNNHFARDGLTLVATRPDRWYLRVLTAPDLSTSPLHRVSGQGVAPYLPSGPDARAWNRWQNEAQMLFYQDPVNQAREAVAKPAISGIWTWGGGVLPQVVGGPDLIIAEHPLARGLARAAGARSLGLDDLIRHQFTRSDPPPAHVLVFWDRIWWPAIERDWDAWSRAIAGLESLIAGQCTELAAGRVCALTLDVGEGWSFGLNRWALRRFWRRRGTLRQRIEQAARSQRPS